MGLCDHCSIKYQQNYRCGICQSQDDGGFNSNDIERTGINGRYFKMYLEAIPGNDKGVLHARDGYGEVEFTIKQTELKSFIQNIKNIYGWEI